MEKILQLPYWRLPFFSGSGPAIGHFEVFFSCGAGHGVFKIFGRIRSGWRACLLQVLANPDLLPLAGRFFLCAFKFEKSHACQWS